MAGKIKLYGPSGYTEIAADVDADDNVLTLPSTGTTLATDVDLASKLNIAGGKILQIVRATDSTARSTSSTSLVDANISVTITPQKNDSAVLLLWTARVQGQGNSNTDTRFDTAITDSSNNIISGTEAAGFGTNQGAAASNYSNETILVVIGYATPATTSATTFKVRFRAVASTTGVTIRNNVHTGQMFALEISA